MATVSFVKVLAIQYIMEHNVSLTYRMSLYNESNLQSGIPKGILRINRVCPTH